MFGYALILAGILRVVEVCFVLNDSATPSPTVRIFQHLPPYLLVLGGIMFMSATNEEMKNAHALGIDHVSYALFDFSLSFLVYLVITFLIHLYSNSGRNAGLNAEEEPEAGYAKLNQHGEPVGLPDGPEVFELTEHDGSENGTELTGDEDAVKIGTEDEVDWMGQGRRRGVQI